MAHLSGNTIRWMVGMALFAAEAGACSVTGILSGVDLVKTADSVVRARAVAYADPPRDPDMRTTGVPDSRVRFQVVETLRGPSISELVLNGYLVSRDDFNDRKPPYTFVRPGGRSGSCFANSYRQDAEFLLFLKKNKEGDLTVNWAALAPVNEQLHSDRDPWLLWVRREAEKLANAHR